MERQIKVAYVSDQVPDFHKSGKNHVIHDYIQFFEREGFCIDYIVYSKHVDFLLTCANRFPYTLHAQGVFQAGPLWLSSYRNL